jgi:hypothetical protein
MRRDCNLKNWARPFGRPNQAHRVTNILFTQTPYLFLIQIQF